jgi:hypothetical protein
VRLGLLWTLMVVMVAVPAFGGPIVSLPDLGTAVSFGLLAGVIDNTGPTTKVVGNVGATVTITGFNPSGTSDTGFFYTAPNAPGTTVGIAYADFVTAYNNAFSDALTPPTLPVDDLTMDRTFYGNNVYKFTASDVTSTAAIILHFDALSDSSNVFFIKIPHDLQINAPITFSLENGALASNIYWIIGRDATISGATAVVPVTWEGSILVGRNFTMSAGTGGSGPLAGTINGCLFVENVNTFGGTTQVNGGCASAAAGAVPEPGSAGLVALGCLLGALRLRKFRFVRRTR